MIRFIITSIFVILFLILSIPILLFVWILGKKNQSAADFCCLRVVQWTFKVILFLSGAKLTVLGEENVPKKQAVLYIPNHQSYFDIVITYARCPGLTGYVAKASMLSVPLLSTWMKHLYCLFLDRDDIREGLKMILTGIDQIKNGVSMCIFPEGTRNKDPKHMMAFKEGSMKMAEKSGCPIIPIAITNSAEIWENHMPFIKPCHVILQYGTPVYPKDLEKEERKFLGAYTKGKIQEMLDTHEALL